MTQNAGGLADIARCTLDRVTPDQRPIWQAMMLFYDGQADALYGQWTQAVEAALAQASAALKAHRLSPDHAQLASRTGDLITLARAITLRAQTMGVKDATDRYARALDVMTIDGRRA